ncbi:hypothetical protein [Mesorhizobium sp. M4B.F.Ca.ET.200.01.1.1]|uniref:hypothetical protein n=1 Tax=Mesorhizobium sp. M4B.F.Ca.ET.200.01.1.1 TaxID=2563952 RepID=UPI001FE13D4B|nr:hypothetical protein [Mesorhizobium sp. M4B.F.Ca.ET.200.01.1.1]
MNDKPAGTLKIRSKQGVKRLIGYESRNWLTHPPDRGVAFLEAGRGRRWRTSMP